MRKVKKRQKMKDVTFVAISPSKISMSTQSFFVLVVLWKPFVFQRRLQTWYASFFSWLPLHLTFCRMQSKWVVSGWNCSWALLKGVCKHFSLVYTACLACGYWSRWKCNGCRRLVVTDPPLSGKHSALQQFFQPLPNASSNSSCCGLTLQIYVGALT